MNTQLESALEALSKGCCPEGPFDLSAIPKGDMPGDKVEINADHVMKARAIFARLSPMIAQTLSAGPSSRAVVSVYGGSGVGKSEIGSLLSYYLNELGIGSYLLSGDNYPRRIPRDNDYERQRLFREQGLKGLVSSGEYTAARMAELRELQEKKRDSDPAALRDYPWLASYQKAGRSALESYLGTPDEIDFGEINGIIGSVKAGSGSVFLKRMGRDPADVWYDAVDFSNVRVLIIEWTHGNSGYLDGVDIPVLLNSTPEETLAHRRSRNRDGAVDSSFTSMVLAIEQELLARRASLAKLIIAKNGDILSFRRYLESMPATGTSV
ncbi:MAG: hypothetical protein JXP39_10295 [Spirochaetales bacterium]|nr:hypothetical protein [Spirochaetales bacterium]